MKMFKTYVAFLSVVVAMALTASFVNAQEYQCADVPAGHKLVVIPWWVPEEELTYEWHPAKSATPAEADSPSPCDSGGLVVSPCVSTD
jgi:hypothetical protein